MAKTMMITDDLDGSANAETLEFSVDGAQYSIDLSKKNRAALDKLLKPYITAATKSSSRGGRRSNASGRGRSQRSTTQGLAAVRAWATSNGYEVAPRGRIAQSVVDAYHAAQG